MLHASTRKLIDRLAEMTELGKLDWTEGENGSVTYSTEGYSVSLTNAPNELVITSKDGKQLEHATREELAATPGDDGSTYTDIVGLMTKEAGRVARGTEAAISSLLAGMDPVENAAAEAEPEAETQLREDPVDETMELAAVLEESQNEEAPAESSEMAAESGTEDESIDPVAAMPDSPEPHSEDSTLENAIADAEQSDDETETGVTEAVARMADEVNQREDDGSALGAAAASAVGAVALAAGLDAETETEPAPDSPSEAAPDDTVDRSEASDISAAASDSETIEPAASDSQAMAAPIPEEQDSSAPAYVPFGLEPDDIEETGAEESAEIAPFAMPDLPDSSLDEPAPVDEVETAAEQEARLPSLTPAEAIVTLEAEETVAPEAPQEAPEHDQSAPSQTAPEAESASLEFDTAEAQSYSLSGIGAGFGLGALSSRTEASGVPSASPSSAAAPEKIVIDATDDVLPELEGNINLPLVEKATAAVRDAASEAPDKPRDDSPESDILKPRTRFNPWD